MSKDYAKIPTNIFDNSKIKLIRSQPDGDSLFSLWIGLSCLCWKSKKPGFITIDEKIPTTEKTLSIELNIPKEIVSIGLKMFESLEMICIYEDSSIFFYGLSRDF